MQIDERFNSAKRAIAIWIDQKRVSHFIGLFVIGVLLFSIAYFVLTSFQEGIASNTTPASQITVWTSIYFSVVTVSTLGYGDIIPQGFSKILACLEVVFGLTMMGIIVAKLTSGRLSYHVRRLFRSDAQKRLEAYSAAFEIVQLNFTQLSPMVGDAFQEIPSSNAPTDRAKCASEFSKALSSFHVKSLSFSRDIVFELEQGDYFSDAPPDALQNTAASIEQSLYFLGQLILGLPILSRPLLLNTDNRRRMSEIIGELKRLDGKVSQHCKNEQLRQTFSTIAERCENIPAQYFSFPSTGEERGQPNLVAPNIDQPQAAQ
jgi:hypothetical protein